MRDDLLYVWFQMALGICNRLAGEILSKFGSISEIYNCDDFSFLGEKRERYINNLENKDTASAFEVMKRCQALGVRITGYYDPLYPASLRRINIPPAVLYSIGDFKNLNNVPCIAIVGTRKMSDYGKNVAENFAYTFAKSGACVISGLARGVDTAAHRGAVMAGGYTVGVLGNPIGDVYPKENIKAFQTLYERGLVISEMYPGCPRTKADFPNRNRIISGISSAIVVAEAGEGSGSLITARCGTQQGKAVFAVPGAIGAENAGTNSLIKAGIPAATDPQDVLSVLTLDYPEVIKVYEPAVTSELRSYGRSKGNKTETVSVPKEEQTITPCKASEETVGDKILRLLKNQNPMTADEIVLKTGVPVSEVMTELTMLEIDGSVIACAGGRYTVTKA